ncbi:hypothetical protein EKH55_1957 [Sinorhizobium alkalisoli]|nr:hypothetical protein EKH55_1957 [Sinorhizobium alkalisoli]
MIAKEQRRRADGTVDHYPDPIASSRDSCNQGRDGAAAETRQRLKRERGEDARKGPMPWLPPQL